MFRSTTVVADRQLGDVLEEKSNGDETYNCELCSDGECSSETEVEQHKYIVHAKRLLHLINGKIEGLCKICIQHFHTRDNLVKHIKSEHLLSSEDALRVERDIFICDVCERIFFNKKHIAIHMVYYHYKLPPKTKLECPRCGKLIKYTNLWYHFQLHKIQSVASCRICFYKCKNRRHLREHTKTHVKHMVCNICQYETKKEELFKQHIVTKHRNNDRKFNYKSEPYFVPKFEQLKLQRVSSFRGLPLIGQVRICVLCKAICASEFEMIEHINEHMVVPKLENVSHECSCGDTFLNKVLLKHHIFKLKGDHKDIYSDTKFKFNVEFCN